jgi:hypothetical protein
MSVMRFWYRVLSIGLQTLDPGLICVYVRAEQARGMYVMAEQATEGCMGLNNEEITVWSLTKDHGARKPRRDVWEGCMKHGVKA